MKKLQNILIVEDDKPHCFMLKVILKSWGYATFVAASGTDISETLRERCIDMVVMDINLTRRSDMEILTRVKNLSSQMPIILMTAYSPADMIAELKRSGAAEVLTKPLKLEELEATFKKACHNRCRLPSA
jgi:DNA-binding NtrC family response regulator